MCVKSMYIYSHSSVHCNKKYLTVPANVVDRNPLLRGKKSHQRMPCWVRQPYATLCVLSSMLSLIFPVRSGKRIGLMLVRTCSTKNAFWG